MAALGPLEMTSNPGSATVWCECNNEVIRSHPDETDTQGLPVFLGKAGHEEGTGDESSTQHPSGPLKAMKPPSAVASNLGQLPSCNVGGGGLCAPPKAPTGDREKD